MPNSEHTRVLQLDFLTFRYKLDCPTEDFDNAGRIIECPDMECYSRPFLAFVPLCDLRTNKDTHTDTHTTCEFVSAITFYIVCVRRLLRKKKNREV